MNSPTVPYASDLHLFHQATKLPLFIFDNNLQALLRYPLFEGLTFSASTLGQCLSLLENTAPYTPRLFASDNFFFALLKPTPETNIVIGPVSSAFLSYREFYDSNKDDCEPDDLTYLYRVIQQSPHISLAQFAANVCLFIKSICGNTLTVQDVLAAQLKIPKHYATPQTSVFTEPHYASVNEAKAFEKTILYHIQNGNLNEIKKLFQAPNFFNDASLMPSSVDEYHKIFFVYATLCCIASMEEGLDAQKAFPIFDGYISKIPALSSRSELLELCRDVSLEYCQQIIYLHEFQSDSAVITHCLQYIHSHLHYKITLEELANHCHLSKRSITRHFSKHFHTSVSDYILNEKLKEAAFLLANSGFSLSEISHQLAFSSQSHLTVAFKKKYFYTPQQYREKYKHREPLSM